MPNCGSLVPKLCALNISRISDQFVLNRAPNTRPTISETATAMRRALRELTLLPISMVSPLIRIVDPSAPSGRARMASVAERKLTAAMTMAYATHRPIRVPSCVQITLWKPSWAYHMTSVMKRASAKKRPTIMASASTMPRNIRFPLDWRGRFGLPVMRGPEDLLGGMPAVAFGASSPSVSTSRMIGSSPDPPSRRFPERPEPSSGSNMGPNISKKDMATAYRQARSCMQWNAKRLRLH